MTKYKNITDDVFMCSFIDLHYEMILFKK